MIAPRKTVTATWKRLLAKAQEQVAAFGKCSDHANLHRHVRDIMKALDEKDEAEIYR